MLSYEIKIPRDRVAALIGKKGVTKKELEERTKSTLRVDSKEGEIIIHGEDGVLLYAAQLIIKAIGRGFNPEVAMQLTKQDYAYESISLIEYHEKKNHQERLKGRVIGREGKSRDIIESLTGTNISVYGKTIGIIGPVDTMGLAKQAIEMLLEGSNHSTVYAFLERKQRELRIAELTGKKGF